MTTLNFKGAFKYDDLSTRNQTGQINLVFIFLQTTPNGF